MPNMAKCTLIGHLGRDAETKFLPNDRAVVSFSIATTRKRKDSEVTTWWRCQWWGDRAIKVAEYLTKGKAVCVIGDAYMRDYEGKDGGKKQSLEVDVSDLALLGGGEQRQDGAGIDPSNPEARNAEPPPSRPVRSITAADEAEPPF